MLSKFIFATLSLVLALVDSALAAEQPPSSALPLSQILQTLEQKDAGVFDEIEWMDEGYWRINSVIDVDPITAASKTDRPSGAQPLSRILSTLEQGGDLAYFDEIDWEEKGYWKIEYISRDGKKLKIRVDPVTGQVLSE